MGKLVEIKTKENDSDVESFINAVKDEEKRKDSFILLRPKGFRRNDDSCSCKEKA
jgi:hypothetical protein